MTQPERDPPEPFDDDHLRTRVSLVERDVLYLSKQLAALDQRLASVQKLLVGVLVSTATAAVLLAINLAVGNVGG